LVDVELPEGGGGQVRHDRSGTGEEDRRRQAPVPRVRRPDDGIDLRVHHGPLAAIDPSAHLRPTEPRVEGLAKVEHPVLLGAKEAHTAI